MTEQNTEQERVEQAPAEQESTGPGGDSLRNTSSQFRMAAGLPERESDEPITNGPGSQIHPTYEPEGGYGGEGDFANTSATNASERARQELRDEQVAARAEAEEETGLTGGETATEVARVTGEDVPDVKPAPGATAESEAVDADADEDADEDEEK